MHACGVDDSNRDPLLRYGQIRMRDLCECLKLGCIVELSSCSQASVSSRHSDEKAMSCEVLIALNVWQDPLHCHVEQLVG